MRMSNNTPYRWTAVLGGDCSGLLPLTLLGGVSLYLYGPILSGLVSN